MPVKSMLVPDVEAIEVPDTIEEPHAGALEPFEIKDCPDVPAEVNA
jgi:hypothetical protein